MRVWSRSSTSVLRGRPSGPGRCGGSSGRRLRRATLEMCGRLDRKFRKSAAASAYAANADHVSDTESPEVPLHMRLMSLSVRAALPLRCTIHPPCNQDDEHWLTVPEVTWRVTCSLEAAAASSGVGGRRRGAGKRPAMPMLPL